MAAQLNLEMMEKSLNLERFAGPEKIEWLEKSWEPGSDFWPSLCKVHDGLFARAGKSLPFRQYDFFHDLITRNLNRENPAFIWYDPLKLWQQISYQALGQKAEQLSGHWQNSGVMPGETLCIIKKFNLGYLVSLLAGLRTGVILSFILPEGKALIKKQLEALQPDHIATDSIYHPLLSEWQDIIINGEGGPETSALAGPSHTYMAGEVAGRFFDPMCEAPFTPKKILSDRLYLSGIRDGLMGLGLRPGDLFAAPGFNPVLTHSCFVLAVLINGATCLHVSMEEIKKNPDLLTIYPLKSMGITSELRDILMARPVRKARIWDAWFRDPADSSDMHIWDRFIKKLELEDIPAGCMVWNAAVGGCLLFSRRRKGQALQNVLPLPGRKWQLSMMENDTTPALGGVGLFSLNASLENEAESYLPTPCILAETHLEQLFVGVKPVARKGVYYPRGLVTEIVQKIDACRDAVVATIPKTGSETSPGFHLLVFTGHLKVLDTTVVIENIRKTLRSEMGKSFFVDDIKICPFYPRRREDNTIDEEWCCSQYLSGGLKDKLEDDLFLCLSGLRAHALINHTSNSQ
jgi:hypothetical protein